MNRNNSEQSLSIMSLLKKPVKYTLLKLKFAIFYFSFIKDYTTAKKSKNPIIFFMATPTHGNLGDHAIVYAEYGVFKRMGKGNSIVEVSNFDYIYFREWIQKKVTPNDVIIIDGGGSLGSLWPHEDDKIRDIITRFKENKIFIFPQTCYYDSGENDHERIVTNINAYKSAEKLTISLRDKISYNFMSANFLEQKLLFLPDIVLSITNAPKAVKRKGALLCFREDCEKMFGDSLIQKVKAALLENNIDYSETSTVINKKVTKKIRCKELEKKWTEFSKAEIIITDRLHAMIFAAITATPCIAFDNKSKKVSGSYEIIKELPYICFLNDLNDISAKINFLQRFSGNQTENQEYNFKYPENRIKEFI